MGRWVHHSGIHSRTATRQATPRPTPTHYNPAPLTVGSAVRAPSSTLHARAVPRRRASGQVTSSTRRCTWLTSAMAAERVAEAEARGRCLRPAPPMHKRALFSKCIFAASKSMRVVAPFVRTQPRSVHPSVPPSPCVIPFRQCLQARDAARRSARARRAPSCRSTSSDSVDQQVSGSGGEEGRDGKRAGAACGAGVLSAWDSVQQGLAPLLPKRSGT